MVFLEVKDLKSGYRENLIIKEASFSVRKGEFIGIIGPNGAGKTTLLRTLTHIIKPVSGNVYLEGKDIHRMRSLGVARKIAMVSQALTAVFSFTVEEIVLMGRSAHIGIFGYETKNDLGIVNEVIKLTELEELKDRPIDELSAGEKQRAIIAKALAQTPQLLLLDEPTSHLDIGHQIEILDLIRSLKEKKDLTVICVLHDLNLASQYCDRIMLLNKGIIEGFAPPKEILKFDIIEKIFHCIVLVNNETFPDRPLVVPVSRNPNL